MVAALFHPWLVTSSLPYFVKPTAVRAGVRLGEKVFTRFRPAMRLGTPGTGESEVFACGWEPHRARGVHKTKKACSRECNRCSAGQISNQVLSALRGH